jgi:hypothetical protein
MDNSMFYRMKQEEVYPEDTTDSGPKPAEFPIGTRMSRAAARVMVERRKKSRSRMHFIMMIHRLPWAPPKDDPANTERGMEAIFIEDMTPEERIKYGISCTCDECERNKNTAAGLKEGSP